MLSKTSKAVVEAHRRGYRVADGQLYNPKGISVSGGTHKGYKNYSIRMDGKKCVFMIHRLVSYQKFGIKALFPGVETRHLDGNSLNNLSDNIATGTAKDNTMDKPAEQLKRIARANGMRRLKHNHKKVIALHNRGLTHKEIMSELDISAAGTVSYIINKSLESKGEIA